MSEGNMERFIRVPPFCCNVTMAETLLDDKFKDGVWYDAQAGEACRIIKTEKGIGLVEPDGNDETPYFVYGEGNSEEFRPGDFQQVDERAVENPAQYVREYAELVASAPHNRLTSMTVSEEISLRYALKQVEIVERNS